MVCHYLINFSRIMAIKFFDLFCAIHFIAFRLKLEAKTKFRANKIDKVEMGENDRNI